MSHIEPKAVRLLSVSTCAVCMVQHRLVKGGAGRPVHRRAIKQLFSTCRGRKVWSMAVYCTDVYSHRRRMETETKAKCRRFGMGVNIECRTENFGVIVQHCAHTFTFVGGEDLCTSTDFTVYTFAYSVQ